MVLESATTLLIEFDIDVIEKYKYLMTLLTFVVQQNDIQFLFILMLICCRKCAVIRIVQSIGNL